MDNLIIFAICLLVYLIVGTIAIREQLRRDYRKSDWLHYKTFLHEEHLNCVTILIEIIIWPTYLLMTLIDRAVPFKHILEKEERKKKEKMQRERDELMMRIKNRV